MARKYDEYEASPDEASPGFNVTVEMVIGTVTYGTGTVNPYVAAMSLIGEHGQEGVFRFPHENSKTVEVAVSHNEPR